MKSVLIRLQEYENQASSAEKNVIQMILKNPDMVVKCSIHQLAQEAFTSSSTIVRLCNKLEFKGYKEFHKALIYELAIRKKANVKKLEKIKREDSLEEIVDKVTYRNIISLEKSRKLVNDEVLEEAVNALMECECIFLFGIGASLLVAKDAYLKFMRIGKRCQVYDDWHGQLLCAKNMTPSDIAVIVSYSGLTGEMIECGKEVKKTGAKIIAITRFEASVLAKMADYCLNVASTELMFRSGAMASRISQLNMVDILYTVYVNKHYDENLERISKTYMNKTDQSDEEQNYD